MCDVIQLLMCYDYDSNPPPIFKFKYSLSRIVPLWPLHVLYIDNNPTECAVMETQMEIIGVFQLSLVFASLELIVIILFHVLSPFLFHLNRVNMALIIRPMIEWSMIIVVGKMAHIMECNEVCSSMNEWFEYENEWFDVSMFFLAHFCRVFIPGICYNYDDDSNRYRLHGLRFKRLPWFSTNTTTNPKMIDVLFIEMLSFIPLMHVFGVWEWVRVLTSYKFIC